MDFSQLTMENFMGTGHLAYFNGTACPITLPYKGVPWMKLARDQYKKGLEHEGSEEALRKLLIGQIANMENILDRICAGGFSTEEKIDEWCRAMGMEEQMVATIWYLDVYTLQHFLNEKVDNNFGILLTYEKESKKKKQKVNDPCDCGSGKKYKKCCMFN